MQIDGFFIRISCNIFDPTKIAIKDPLLLIALNNFSRPQLIPEKFLKELQTTYTVTSQTLFNYSLNTDIGRFSPKKAYDKWLIENEKCTQRFNFLRDNLILHYETFNGFITTSNKNLINLIWETLHPNEGKPNENFIIEVNKKIINLLPKKEDLYNDIYLKYMGFQIPDKQDLKNTNTTILKQIKLDLCNIINTTFSKVIRFYEKEHKIRRNMLKRFKRKIDDINLLYFPNDMTPVVKEIDDMMYNDVFKNKPSEFIYALKTNQQKLIKETELYL